MRIKRLILAMCCILFIVNSAQSKPEENVHLIIAYDLSKSMQNNEYQDWPWAGAQFFQEYFANYRLRCQAITVDYFGWGNVPFPAIHRRLTSRAVAEEYGKVLYATSLLDLKSTNPKDAMLYANSLVTPGFDRTVIIFISDADYVGEGNEALGELVSPSTEFIGISLGRSSSYSYFGYNIIPPHGQHFHAQSREKFTDIMKSILDELGYEHCPMS